MCLTANPSSLNKVVNSKCSSFLDCWPGDQSVCRFATRSAIQLTKTNITSKEGYLSVWYFQSPFAGQNPASNPQNGKEGKEKDWLLVKRYFWDAI